MHFMKKVFTLFFVLLSTFLKAQQDPQFSLNMFNLYSVNPAFSGSYDQFNALAIHRSQWVGFGAGAPVTQHVSVEAPVYFLHGGAGVSLLNDKIGNEYTRGVNLSYAYQTKLSKKSELGVGLSIGFMDVGFEGEWVTPSNNSGTDDPSVPATGENDIVPDLGLGVYYRMKELYVGYSITHLNQATAVYGNNNDTDFEFRRHHYFTMGWMHEVSSELMIRPSMFVKTDQVSTQIDFNINLMYADHLWGGVTYLSLIHI